MKTKNIKRVFFKKIISNAFLVLGIGFLVIAAMIYGTSSLLVSEGAYNLLGNASNGNLSFYSAHQNLLYSSIFFIISASFLFGYIISKNSLRTKMFFRRIQMENFNDLNEDQKMIANDILSRRIVIQFFRNFAIFWIAIAIAIYASYSLNIALEATNITSLLQQEQTTQVTQDLQTSINAFNAAHVDLNIAGGFLIIAAVFSFLLLMIRIFNHLPVLGLNSAVTMKNKREVLEILHPRREHMKEKFLNSFELVSLRKIMSFFLLMFGFTLALFLLFLGINSLELGEGASLIARGISQLPSQNGDTISVVVSFLYDNVNYLYSSIIGIVFASFGFLIVLYALRISFMRRMVFRRTEKLLREIN